MGVIEINGSKYITVAEAARILEVTPARLTVFFREGRLRPTWILGRKLLDPGQVREFARTRQRSPGKPRSPARPR